jgi:hypothetical protein
MKPVMGQSVSQGLRDVLLAGDFLKSLRSPFSGDYLIGHLWNCLCRTILFQFRSSGNSETKSAAGIAKDGPEPTVSGV